MPSNVIKPSPVEEEFKKTGIKKEDIQKLRQWLENQPHLPSEHITDLDLILAYNCCDQSAEVTKQVVDLHFTLRTLFVRFFKDRYFDDLVIKTLNVVLTMPLEITTHEGFAASYYRLIDTDSKNFNLADIFRVAAAVMDIWLQEYGTSPGIIIIIDLEGVTLSHVAKLDIIVLQQFLYYLQEAMLVKLKQVHFLNAPSFMDKLLMIIKSFLKKELLGDLKVHHIGSKTIEQYLPIAALPKEAGGQFKTFKEIKEDTLAKLEANADYLMTENKKRVVESLRPGKPKTITDIFGGIEGSFKKLDID